MFQIHTDAAVKASYQNTGIGCVCIKSPSTPRSLRYRRASRVLVSDETEAVRTLNVPEWSVINLRPSGVRRGEYHDLIDGSLVSLGRFEIFKN